MNYYLFNLKDLKTGITYVVRAKSVVDATAYLPSVEDVEIVSSVVNNEITVEGILVEIPPDQKG